MLIVTTCSINTRQDYIQAKQEMLQRLGKYLHNFFETIYLRGVYSSVDAMEALVDSSS